MAISIRGIKLNSASISLGDETEKVTGQYALMSNSDKVLAKQGFNGYGDIQVSLSSETQKSLNAFLNSLKGDINNVLGIVEE